MADTPASLADCESERRLVKSKGKSGDVDSRTVYVENICRVVLLCGLSILRLTAL